MGRLDSVIREVNLRITLHFEPNTKTPRKFCEEFSYTFDLIDKME
jgi:hypothetical protein